MTPDHDPTDTITASPSGPLPIWIVHRRMLHHSPHSGYDRVVDYMPTARTLPRLRLGPAGRLLDAAFRRWVEPNCGLEYYQSTCLRDELGLLVHQRRHGAGIYHFLYGEDQFWFLGRYSRAPRCKLVASFHQPPPMLAQVLTRTEHLRRLDAVVVVGTNQREFFEPLVGREAVHWVPHGVDVEFFRPLSRRPPVGIRRCLFVGNWLRDFPTLHQVADHLQATYGREVEITVVTEQENHAFLTGCDNVRLLSGIAEGELLRLYQTSDLAILPMLDSTANNVLLESMACGTPAVVTDVGGARDYADDSCCALVPVGDSEAMAMAVTQLLDDAPRRVRMGEAARTVAERFDWRVVARRMSAVYEKLQ